MKSATSKAQAVAPEEPRIPRGRSVTLGPDDWSLFPPAQKLFAFGEAMAHLKYLEEAGELAWGIENEEIVFFVTEN